MPPEKGASLLKKALGCFILSMNYEDSCYIISLKLLKKDTQPKN
jgi:hypothetical protein